MIKTNIQWIIALYWEGKKKNKVLGLIFDTC